MKRHCVKNIEKRGSMCRLLAFVLAAALLPFLPVQKAEAAATGVETVNIEVTYGQTEARKMVDEFNRLRTVNGVSDPAVYDYGLETCAMQRAAELALCFPNKRPDGRRTDTIYADLLPNFTGTDKEMISFYHTSASAVVNEWIDSALDDVILSQDR